MFDTVNVYEIRPSTVAIRTRTTQTTRRHRNIHTLIYLQCIRMCTHLPHPHTANRNI